MNAKLKPVLVAALVGGLLGAILVKFGWHPRPVKDRALMACLMGWVLFSIYWLAASTNAPARVAESRESRRVHEILINCAYALIVVPAALPAAIPMVYCRFIPELTGVKVLGLAIEASAIALAVWARRSLGHNWSGRIEIKMDHQLVRSGPYRVMRHPIYTAVLGITIGMALVIGQAAALLGIAVIVFAYIRKIRLEEANMHAAFGAEYTEYRKSTWGFVPGLY